MKKLTFFLISLLTVFTACSDGLDNVEYNRNSDIVVATPEATVTQLWHADRRTDR